MQAAAVYTRKSVIANRACKWETLLAAQVNDMHNASANFFYLSRRDYYIVCQRRARNCSFIKTNGGIINTLIWYFFCSARGAAHQQNCRRCCWCFLIFKFCTFTAARRVNYTRALIDAPATNAEKCCMASARFSNHTFYSVLCVMNGVRRMQMDNEAHSHRAVLGIEVK